MIITIDTNAIGPRDKEILAGLLGALGFQTEPTHQATAEPTKPAKAQAPGGTPKKTTVQKEPEPAPEPDEDVLGTDAPKATMEDAVKLATENVAAGGVAKVKAVLKEIGGYKRVSELKSDDDIAKFVNHPDLQV